MNRTYCETVVESQRRTVLTVRHVVDAEENSASVRLLWIQRRTVLL